MESAHHLLSLRMSSVPSGAHRLGQLSRKAVMSESFKGLENACWWSGGPAPSSEPSVLLVSLSAGGVEGLLLPVSLLCSPFLVHLLPQ